MATMCHAQKYISNVGIPRTHTSQHHTCNLRLSAHHGISMATMCHSQKYISNAQTRYLSIPRSIRIASILHNIRSNNASETDEGTFIVKCNCFHEKKIPPKTPPILTTKPNKPNTHPSKQPAHPHHQPNPTIPPTINSTQFDQPTQENSSDLPDLPNQEFVNKREA